MGALIAGGGSGAVASSAHAGCTRFRMTDPLLTGRTRRALAADPRRPRRRRRHPVARWVRAMAFERLVHDEAFVSELLTRAVGLLGLDRPDGGPSPVRQATRSTARRPSWRRRTSRPSTPARRRCCSACGSRSSTSRTRPARPTYGPTSPSSRPESSDDDGVGSWLVMGDAKDYERVRSRIDDGRMLKGFLQVALGAESAAAWSRLPDGHGGAPVRRPGRPPQRLPAPRGRRSRTSPTTGARCGPGCEERIARSGRRSTSADRRRRAASTHVAHVEATFDPATCPTCSLFRYCRGELRTSADPAAVLVEIGVPPPQTAGRPRDWSTAPASHPPRLDPARRWSPTVEATATGAARRPAGAGSTRSGCPAASTWCVVKSDAAALGVHGIAVQRLDGSGDEPWQHRVFERTNATETRHDGHGPARPRDPAGPRRAATGRCTWSCPTSPPPTSWCRWPTRSPASS